jgi:hypothetical protein
VYEALSFWHTFEEADPFVEGFLEVKFALHDRQLKASYTSSLMPHTLVAKAAYTRSLRPHTLGA